MLTKAGDFTIILQIVRVGTFIFHKISVIFSFYKNGLPRPLFHLFSSFSNKHYNFYKK